MKKEAIYRARIDRTDARRRILYVASTASHLRRFHQPYLEALKAEFDVFTMANGEGVDYAIPFQKRFFSLQNLRAICSIRKILRHKRFDGVILNTSLAAFLVRIAMIGLRVRPGVLNIVHGYLFDLPVKGIRGRLMLLCEQIASRYTDEIAVMNRADLEIAHKYRLARGKIHFIRGMGYTIGQSCVSPDPALRQNLTPCGERLLTYVGELSARKNQAFLIRCAARFREKGMGIRLMLVGDGKARGELEALIRACDLEHNVILLGNREPVLPYLAVTDLYVSASQAEGLPFNVMEAMACGLPVVASDCKGQSDLLRAYPNRLYPVGDEAAFCSLVERELKEARLGAGAVAYTGLEAYTLKSVFKENLNIMKGFF